VAHDPNDGAEDVDRTRTVGGNHDSPATPEQARPASTGGGKYFGRFELRERIGQGGMGVVYRATDKVLSRDVAIKVLGPGAAAAERRLRLQREAQAMAALSHPNLVTVYEAGIDGDELFIAMEYVHGHTLSAWLSAAPRSWSEILKVMVAAGRGLEAANAAGIVHRDFKPSNVLVGNDGRVQVADFGVALTEASETEGGPDIAEPVKLTKTGVALGTPKYMAPEQHQARKLDARADQFSFALTLTEAVYGEHPFAAESYRMLVHEVLDGDPKLPADRGPDGLAPILRRALARNPADRYPSMTEFLAELEQLGERSPMPWRAIAITAGLIAIAVAAVLLGRSTGAEMVVAAVPEATVAHTDSEPAADSTATPVPATTTNTAPAIALDAAVAHPSATAIDAGMRRPHKRRRSARAHRVPRPRTATPPVPESPDAGVARITKPAARIGVMVYANRRCAIDHENHTCGRCCRRDDRFNGELLMPYPNCGCYYNERLRQQAARKRGFHPEISRRVGKWVYQYICKRSHGVCRNCCPWPYHRVDPKTCACYVNFEAWKRAGKPKYRVP